MVRRRRPPDDPAPLAREAAQGGRAGRAAGPGAAGDVLAGAGAPRAPGSTRCSTSIENLQGAPLPASILESEILSARIDGYAPGDLDALAAAGEVVWRGVEPVGDRDGRVALYLTDHLSRAVAARRRPAELADARAGDRRAPEDGTARRSSRRFTRPPAAAIPGETVDALWDLVWKGLADQRHVPRAARVHAGAGAARPPQAAERAGAAGARSAAGASRRRPRKDDGRCSRIACPSPPSDTQWSTAMAQQLLARYGVVTREVAAAEGIAGGFGAVYDVLKALEDAGRVRRGYFVGVGATQFALPPALELLRIAA